MELTWHCDDKGGYDTFEILREDLSANLIQMFQEPELESDSNATRAVKRLYASCMDVGEFDGCVDFKEKSEL